MPMRKGETVKSATLDHVQWVQSCPAAVYRNVYITFVSYSAMHGTSLQICSAGFVLESSKGQNVTGEDIRDA